MGVRPGPAVGEDGPHTTASPGAGCLWCLCKKEILSQGEKRDKCRAKDNSFKCGVFFYDLLGKGGYQYLTELPQALHKTSEKHWKEILGDDITFETFNTSIICDEARGRKAYNSRCYGMFSKIVGEPLDSCDRNVLVSKADETWGDYLCGQVRRWLKNDPDFSAGGKRDIGIRFRYSFCNNDWEDVAAGGQLLAPEESLCCTKDGKFERCNGGSFKRFC